MKGNRLNTAANVGSFVTGRQQLKTQRQIAGTTDSMLAIQHQQAQEADYDRLIARTDREVAEGRMTRSEADTHVKIEWYNRLNPAPAPKARVTPTISAGFDAQFASGGAPAGWYRQDLSSSRYWGGSQWTLQTMPTAAIRAKLKQEWLAVTAEGHVQKSRLTAGLLGIFLGFVGAHRFYLGHKGLGALQISVFVIMVAFTFGIPSLIWGVIEGIMILRGASAFERDAIGVPLRS